jgi:anti-sigma factor NepR-like protein
MADRGRFVDRDANKKDRRRKMPGVGKKKMDHAVDSGANPSNEAPGTELDEGLSPTLQAHIGRHVRAVFDEVAREPIPEHLLRLLKDLERSGDK